MLGRGGGEWKWRRHSAEYGEKGWVDFYLLQGLNVPSCWSCRLVQKEGMAALLHPLWIQWCNQDEASRAATLDTNLEVEKGKNGFNHNHMITTVIAWWQLEAALYVAAVPYYSTSDICPCHLPLVKVALEQMLREKKLYSLQDFYNQVRTFLSKMECYQLQTVLSICWCLSFQYLVNELIRIYVCTNASCCLRSGLTNGLS